MKRRISIFLTVFFSAALLLFSAVPAFCDENEYQYVAEVRIDCSMRSEPRDNAPVEVRLHEGMR